MCPFQRGVVDKFGHSQKIISKIAFDLVPIPIFIPLSDLWNWVINIVFISKKCPHPLCYEEKIHMAWGGPQQTVWHQKSINSQTC